MINKENIIQERTLYDICKSKGYVKIGDLEELLIGKRLRTTKGMNISGHNYPAKFKVKSIHPDYYKSVIALKSSILFQIEGANSYQTTGIYLTELVLDTITVQEMKEAIASLVDKQLEIQKDISICEELGIEEYDETLFKTIKAIDKIKSSKNENKIEEAKELIELLGQ